jgi:hypothetical protein
MKRFSCLILISIYLMVVSFSNNQISATSLFPRFPNDDSWWFFKQFDAFRKSMDEFRKSFERKFNTFSSSNETSIFGTRKNSNSSSKRRFEQNSVKCINFTCKLCSHVEMKEYNISDRGFRIRFVSW